MVNYKLLNDKIDASGYKRSYIAENMGLTAASLSLKINGKRAIMLDDVPAFQRALNLTRKEIIEIFFAESVDE